MDPHSNLFAASLTEARIRGFPHFTTLNWRGRSMLMCVCQVKAKVTQSCLTVCDPMDCSLSGFSVHGILQARITRVGCHSFPSPGDLPNSGIEPRLNTRPFRYNLNQIPYDHTMEEINRFKGLDQRECLKNCGQRFITLYRKQ